MRVFLPSCLRLNDWMKDSMYGLLKSTCVFLLTDFSVQCFMSDICLVSVSVSAGQILFLISRKTLVSVSLLEKC